MIDIGRLLRCAVDNGILEMCKHLVEHHGADLRSRDLLGKSPIIYAFGAWHESKAIITYLTSKLSAETLQSELNHQDAFGRTALHYAIYKGNEDTMQFCFERGSDPSIRVNSGKSIWQILRTWNETDNGCKLTILLYTHMKAHLNLPLFFFTGSDLFGRGKVINKGVPLEKISSILKMHRTEDMHRMQLMHWMHIPCPMYAESPLGRPSC